MAMLQVQSERDSRHDRSASASIRFVPWEQTGRRGTKYGELLEVFLNETIMFTTANSKRIIQSESKCSTYAKRRWKALSNHDEHSVENALPSVEEAQSLHSTALYWASAETTEKMADGRWHAV